MRNTQGDPLPTPPEVDELHQLIDNVRRCAMSLVSRHGDSPATRRIVNDAERLLNGVDRLDIDVQEFKLKQGLDQLDGPTVMVQIPDTEYDIDFWRDVDHEGVGGRR
jgi:hypothetical protein